MVKRPFALAMLLAILSSTLLSGCAHHAKKIRNARASFFAGDLENAQTQFESLVDKRDRGNEAILADQAIVSLAMGRAQEAEAILQRVRDGFDHLEQKSAAESALSLLTDDRQRAYAGEDYEKVLVRDLLAVSNLMHGGSDAVPYLHQASNKQNQIIQLGGSEAKTNPKLAYKRIAFGAYLFGAVQEATHRNFDDAERAYRQVAEWEPSFVSGKSDLQRATTGVHSAPGHGVVYVLAMVGRGPFKKETTAPVTSDVLLIASQILQVMGDYKIPAASAAVKIPTVVIPPSNIDSVFVSAIPTNSSPTSQNANRYRNVAGPTEVLIDVGEIALGQFEANRNQIIARAVARRIAKKATVYTAKDQISSDNDWSNLAMDAVGFLWEASESADTRGWSLLPRTFQVRRLELPAGDYHLALQPAFGGRLTGTPRQAQVSVLDGLNSYVLAYFPSQDLVGKILVSR